MQLAGRAGSQPSCRFAIAGKRKLTLRWGESSKIMYKREELGSREGAKLNAFVIPPKPLLVHAIPRRWRTNGRRRVGSKQRARANTDSLD